MVATMTQIRKIKKGRGIAFRMLVLMIIFIAVIFTAVFVSFNFSIGNYVKRETNQQLERAMHDVKNSNLAMPAISFGSIGIGSRIYLRELTKDEVADLIKENPGYYYEMFYKAIVGYLRDLEFDEDINMVLYNARYERLYPNESYSLFHNLDEMDSLISNIKTNGLTAKNRSYRTLTSHGRYYLSSIDIEESYGLSGLSLTFYINTAKYDEFIDTVNFMLLIILIIAMILSFIYVVFISRNISKPIQELSSFADEIGRGVFTMREYNFCDREFIDLNNRMNVMAKKLEKSDEDQKTFFQNVSHELKTPLMSIKGYAEGIKYGVFTEDAQMQEASDIIMSEADRLNELVSDLLYISKLDLYKESGNKTIVNLTELVKSCAEKLKGLLINTHKEMKISFAEENLYMECDENAVIRAILNVMANCVQYAASVVDISLYSESGNAIICVRDDGKGIDEKDMPNIFRRFYKGKSGKHGIGLAIAKAIVDYHGGEIKACNNKDTAGAEFMFKFPEVRIE